MQTFFSFLWNQLLGLITYTKKNLPKILNFIHSFTAFVDLGNDDRMYSPVGTKDNGIDYNAYHYPTSPQQFQMDERK